MKAVPMKSEPIRRHSQSPHMSAPGSVSPRQPSPVYRAVHNQAPMSYMNGGGSMPPVCT